MPRSKPAPAVQDVSATFDYDIAVQNMPMWAPHRPARPDKAEGGRKFKLVSDYEPAGDQPQAIRELTGAALDDEKSQVLLGVTGSGKTFTMAKVIETLQRPALVMAPNKILAA